MFTESQTLRPAAAVGVAIALIAIIVGAARAVAAGTINAVNPGTGGGSPNVYHFAAPRLEPPDAAGYVVHQAGTAVKALDARPVAQFSTAPASLPNVTVNQPSPLIAPPATTVAYQILASVRYAGGGHSVLVTTARPNATAAQRPTVYGSYTTRLANGTTAWAQVGMPYQEPNQLVFLHNDLIITVASDLPINDIAAFAAQVVIR